MLQSKKKVLQLHQAYNIQPIEVSDLSEQVVKGLPKGEYEVKTLFITGGNGVNTKNSMADETIYLDLKKNDLKGLRLKSLYRLFRILRDEKFDIVICNRFKPTSLMMILNCLVGRPKCISVVHNLSDYKPLFRRLMVGVNASKWNFVAVSKSVRDGLFNMKCGFNEENVTLIENAIENELLESLFLSKSEARKELKIPHDKVVVGTIGRLEKVKGHIDLIHGFEKIHKQFPNVIMVIIGEGKERERLEIEIMELNLTEKVFLTGAVGGASQYAKAFDIWIMPSHSEGLPLALMEAMTAKLPILTSRISALEPIVLPAGGWCFEVANPDSLADTLSKFLQLTPLEYEEKGRQAYNYLITEYSIEKYRNSYRRLIEGLINDD